ncbi:MAG: glycosyltransferase [Candidatus Hermodarchaeota archaeon]
MKFLYIGRYSVNKRLDQYIELANRFPDHKFYHIGAGAHKLSEQGLRTSKVHILGRVDDQTKINLLKEIDAYISTSDYEGFNLPIIEAIRYKKPVFCKPIQVHCELFGEYPIYCRTLEDFIDRLTEFINSPILPKHELGETLLKKYTWKNSARRLHKIILSELKK